MNTALLPETSSLAEQVRSLLATVECLRHEVAELRQENADLRQEVRSLQCDVGYWKSRHADAVKRNVKLQAELDQAKAEIRQLKSERFGKRSEKHSSTDRSNQLRLAGISLAPGTVTDGLKRIEPLLTPIYEAVRTHHRESNYFHADETRWKVFAEKIR